MSLTKYLQMENTERENYRLTMWLESLVDNGFQFRVLTQGRLDSGSRIESYRISKVNQSIDMMVVMGNGAIKTFTENLGTSFGEDVETITNLLKSVQS